MRIGRVDLDREILVVAEIGNNHEGSVALAERLVGLAAEAGAQAVKFQTIVPERLVAPDQTARLAQLRRLCLGYQDFEYLARAAEREGVLFLSTPFDVESARFLEPLVAAYKIASGDNTFAPLIRVCARSGKPLVVSTGLLDLEGARRVRNQVHGVWAEAGIQQDLALLHCVSQYPVPDEDANLGAIRDLMSLGVTVGYSDHTLGLDAAVLSVALGARIIEKHFTVDRQYSDFRDHQLSADPKELGELVRRVRQASTMLGGGRKEPTADELAVERAARRSVVAARDLPEGHILGADDVTWLRPGGGLEPGQEVQLIGRALAHAVSAGTPLRLQDVAAATGAAAGR